MNTIKTTFAKGKNPFAPKEKRAVRYVDPESLTIANDPLPTRRAKSDDKYSELFSKMKNGQCIVCDGLDAGKIGHALNVWLEKNGKQGDVKTTKNYEADGKGRVWLIIPEKKLRVAA